MSNALPIAIAAAALGVVPALRERLRKPMDDTARQSAPGDFVDLTHGRTHYCWMGSASGPVAVCVHGLTMPSFMWRPLADELAELGFRVLVYDLYGRGFSDRPKVAQSPAFFMQQLHELLNHLNVTEDITLIGYSMGGVIASAYTAHYPHQLRRTILLAPAGMDHNPDRIARFGMEWPLVGDWLFYMGYPSVLKKRTRAMAGNTSSEIQLAQMMNRELTYRGYFRSVLSSLRHTLRRPIPAVHKQVSNSGVPLVAIWGQEDTTIPISSLGKLAQWHRRASQHVIKGAGHGVGFTHAKDVADAIAESAGLR